MKACRFLFYFLALFICSSDLAVAMPLRYIQAGSPSRRIAIVRENRFSEHGVLFLPGFNSKMASNKGNAIADWARKRNCSCTLFDYSGHGKSEGKLQDGTISRWLEESMCVFSEQTQGRQIIVGSSMGGYLALALWKQLLKKSPDEAARIQGLILIAPAWDMTEELLWSSFSKEIQNEILQRGIYNRPSAYGDGPYPISRNLIQDGRKHLLFADGWCYPERCPPIRIIHGARDEDVPHTHSSRLLHLLHHSDKHLHIVQDGDHRLSRPQDLELLRAFLDATLWTSSTGSHCATDRHEISQTDS